MPTWSRDREGAESSDSALYFPNFPITSFSFFHASSRAFTSAACVAFAGEASSPPRMNPWPAPSYTTGSYILPAAFIFSLVGSPAGIDASAEIALDLRGGGHGQRADILRAPFADHLLRRKEEQLVLARIEFAGVSSPGS